MILDELVLRGWRAMWGFVSHATTTVGCNDGRSSKKMKPYLICLLEIERVLPSTSGVPSDQILLFYKKLLGGHRMEPGLSQTEMQAILIGGELAGPPAFINHSPSIFGGIVEGSISELRFCESQR